MRAVHIARDAKRRVGRGKCRGPSSKLIGSGQLDTDLFSSPSRCCDKHILCLLQLNNEQYRNIQFNHQIAALYHSIYTSESLMCSSHAMNAYSQGIDAMSTVLVYTPPPIYHHCQASGKLKTRITPVLQIIYGSLFIRDVLPQTTPTPTGGPPHFRT